MFSEKYLDVAPKQSQDLAISRICILAISNIRNLQIHNLRFHNLQISQSTNFLISRFHILEISLSQDFTISRLQSFGFALKCSWRGMMHAQHVGCAWAMWHLAHKLCHMTRATWHVPHTMPWCLQAVPHDTCHMTWAVPHDMKLCACLGFLLSLAALRGWCVVLIIHAM